MTLAPALALALSLSSPGAAAEGEPGPDWFEGTWEDALAEARAEQRVLLVDFRAEWCHGCLELERRTFADEAVRRELEAMVLFAADVDTEAGGALSRRYSSAPMQLPTLLFLGPDGEPREVLRGFLGPEEFLAEVERILRDEGTIGDLRRRVAAEPSDLGARWTLSEKLAAVGDEEGAERQIREIEARDPERRSLPLRRLDLDRLVDELARTLDVAPVRRFLAGARHDVIRFRGWFAVGKVEEHLARRAAADGDERARREHRAAGLAAWREAWANVPDERVAFAGRAIAASILSIRDEVAPADLAFGLAAARAAARAEPDDGELARLARDLAAAAGDGPNEPCSN